MREDSSITRHEAPRAQRRLGTEWIVFPVVIAVVVLAVVLLRLAL